MNIIESVGVPLSYQILRSSNYLWFHTSGTTKRLEIDNSNDDYGNGVNYNANMHQLVKISTIQKNEQSKQSSHMNNIGITLKLNNSLKNAY